MRALVMMVMIACLSACSAHALPRIVRVDDTQTSAMRTLAAAEIMQRFGKGSLLDALRRLRPLLMPRGTEEPVVYIGDIELAGGIAALAAVPTDPITQVRFLHPATASLRFARPHPYGAIVVDLWRPNGTLRVR